jgi:2-polyprenyl-3-methyl-5-hydroxy-6-metoxy-1,4-benzoquinol methylase
MAARVQLDRQSGTERPDERRTRDASVYTSGEYLDNNPTWHSEDSPWKARHIVRGLASAGHTPSRVFEIGCGAGHILGELSERFPETQFVGFDISDQAIGLARSLERPALTFTRGNAFDLVTPGEYDTLLAIDVFEHVDDYYGFLRRLKPLAKYKIFHIPLDMSALATAIGNENRARKITGHLHYFTKDSALATLEACGYRLVHWHFTDTFTLDFRNLFEGGHYGRKALKLATLGIPRGLLWLTSPRLCARLLGGCSVLAIAQ